MKLQSRALPEEMRQGSGQVDGDLIDANHDKTPKKKENRRWGKGLLYMCTVEDVSSKAPKEVHPTLKPI